MDKRKELSKNIQEDQAIRIILEGTAADVGEKFFESLVENLTRVIDTGCKTKGATWDIYGRKNISRSLCLIATTEQYAASKDHGETARLDSHCQVFLFVISKQLMDRISELLSAQASRV